MEEPEGSGGGFAAEEAENIIECRYYFGLPGSFRTKMSGASWSGASPESRALTEGTGYPNEESIPDSPQTPKRRLLQFCQTGQGYKVRAQYRIANGVVPDVNEVVPVVPVVKCKGMAIVHTVFTVNIQECQ